MALTDLHTGLYAVSSILASLLHRNESNTGNHIDCNLLNSQVSGLVGWLVGRVGGLVGWLVGQVRLGRVGWLVGWLAGRLCG